jgi:hypothetical protein
MFPKYNRKMSLLLYIYIIWSPHKWMFTMIA